MGIFLINMYCYPLFEQGEFFVSDRRIPAVMKGGDNENETGVEKTNSSNETIYEQKADGNYTDEEIYYRDNSAEIKTDDLQVVYFVTNADGTVSEITATQSDTAGVSSDSGTYVLKNVSKQGFELEIPDNVKVQITYNVMFNVLSGWTVSISNDASYEGVSTIHENNDAEIEVHDPTGTLRSNGYVSLRKRDADTRNVLKDAKFKLERIQIDGNGEVDITQISAGSSTGDGLWTTDENGQITFSNLRKTANGRAVIYRYAEVEAPRGYVLDDTPRYFAFTDVDDDTLEKVRTALNVDDIIITERSLSMWLSAERTAWIRLPTMSMKLTLTATKLIRHHLPMRWAARELLPWMRIIPREPLPLPIRPSLM